MSRFRGRTSFVPDSSIVLPLSWRVETFLPSQTLARISRLPVFERPCLILMTGTQVVPHIGDSDGDDLDHSNVPLKPSVRRVPSTT